MVNIECVGGPRDGEVLTVGDGCTQLNLAVYVGEWWRDDTGRVALAVATYAPVTEADRLLHRWIWKAPPITAGHNG